MFCSNCGYELKNGENVCPNCGNVLVAAESAPASRLRSTFGKKMTSGIGMEPLRETELTPPGTYNPIYEKPAPAPVETAVPSDSYSSGSPVGGFGDTGYVERPEPTPIPTPVTTPYDYSSPREYVPAPPTTDNTKIMKIIVAVALLICVWLLPVISVQEYNTKVDISGMKYVEASFNSLEYTFDNIEYLDEMFEESEGVMAFIEPFAYLLYVFASIGVIIGAFSSKKSGGKVPAILGIVGAVSWLITLVVICDAYYEGASVTDVIGYGFWLSCILYVTSAVIASKE